MAGTGTAGPPERSNAGSAAVWAFGIVLAVWVVGVVGYLLLAVSSGDADSAPRDCSAVFSCMTPLESTQLVVMFTGAFAVVAGFVAGTLALIAGAFGSLRYWRPASLGGLMAVIVLAATGVILIALNS